MTARVSAVVPHAPYDYQLHVLQEGFPLHGHAYTWYNYIYSNYDANHSMQAHVYIYEGGGLQ